MKYLGLVVVGGMACASVEHVSVTPLPPDPTPQQRMWFWEAYRPRGDVTEIITSCNGHDCFSSKNKVIQFADGRIARDPEDLAPLVAADSRTMHEAHRATRVAREAHCVWLGGLAMIAGGLVAGADGNQSYDDTERNVGLGVMAAGLVTAIIAGGVNRHIAHAAQDAAIAAYPHDLAEQLHVCFNGVTMVPCELNTPGAPPPPPPRDPNLDQLRPR